MAETVGYMITWTTYGSWLQGDKRGFVKEGEIHKASKPLARNNKSRLCHESINLSNIQRKIVKEAIIIKAGEIDQEILAISVGSKHIHIVAKYIPTPIDRIVTIYKMAAQVELRRIGLKGRIWTRGYDKRFCFDQQSLNQRTNYVNAHKK
jgi:REP element-mobilizing transposase RayT